MPEIELTPTDMTALTTIFAVAVGRRREVFAEFSKMMSDEAIKLANELLA